MGTFTGTKEEFKRYFGPFLRNLVQQITKKHKRDIGICQHCGTDKELESAHLHGRERGKIIDYILKKYKTNGNVTLSLSLFETLFRAEHEDVEQTIIILCKPCHRDYDNDNQVSKPPIVIQTTQTKKSKGKGKRPYNNTQIQQLITQGAKTLDDEELESLCHLKYSKEVLNLDFPLFIKVLSRDNLGKKKEAVKDSSGRNRWTWRYEFTRDGYSYAICTQWYERHDAYITKWLKQLNNSNIAGV